MPDEVTPEVTPAPVPVVEPTPELTPEPIPEPVIDDDGREPGGDDPQAVRARKEYRARKAAQQEAAAQREENIRLQERLRTIEEERQKAKPTEKVYTRAELNAQVDAGNLSRENADRYIDEILTPYQTRIALEAYEATRAEKARTAGARQEIGEYLKYVPDLSNRASVEFKKVADEYQDLLNDGLPDNDITRRRAVKNVYGSLETVRKKHELAELNAKPRTIPSDTGGGGGARSNGKVDISKAPATMVASWDSEGVDDATRERRYRIYLDLKARQNAR